MHLVTVDAWTALGHVTCCWPGHVRQCTCKQGCTHVRKPVMLHCCMFGPDTISSVNLLHCGTWLKYHMLQEELLAEVMHSGAL